jgi:hypothetical protein
MDETAKLCETPPPDYGKIKAALRGVESAVVSFCVHSLQHGTAQDLQCC